MVGRVLGVLADLYSHGLSGTANVINCVGGGWVHVLCVGIKWNKAIFEWDIHIQCTPDNGPHPLWTKVVHISSWFIYQISS